MALAAISLALSSCSGAGAGDNDYVSVQLEDSKMWSLLEVGNGKIVMSDEFFAPASRVVKGSFFVETDNGEFDLYNLKDTKNKLNRSSYSVVTNFNPSGFAIVRVKDEPWQIINTEGNAIATLDKSLMVLSGFSEDGLAKVMAKDMMIGYVNTQGQTPIKTRYKYGTIFSDGIAFVLSKQENGSNYFSAIDVNGQTVFTFSDSKYSDVGLFNDNYMFAVEGDHCVLLDKTGKKIMTVNNGTNLSNLSYHNGNIIYYDGQFYGLKNTEDKILIRAKYASLKFQSDGNLVAVNSNGKYGVISPKDDIITPFDYDMLEYLAPGRYITKSGNVGVLIDSNGKEICEKAFSNFVNRSASASENNLTSLISAGSNSAINSLNGAFDSFSDFINLMSISSEISRYEMMNTPEEDEYNDDLGSVGLGLGEHTGMVNDKTEIVVEVTSVDGNKVFGNIFYPNAVAKYGKTSQTLMPFSGTIEEDHHITLIVKSPTDATYGEDWELDILSGMIRGTIKTTTGKEWSIVL